MRPGLKVGLKIDFPATVKPSMKPHLEGLVTHRLYATWAMVYHMETVSRMLLAPYLETFEEAVGGAILVKHLKPARIGAQLHIVCKLVRYRYPRVYTKVDVFSKERLIGTGSILQVVVTRRRFARMLRETR